MRRDDLVFFVSFCVFAWGAEDYELDTVLIVSRLSFGESRMDFGWRGRNILFFV